MKLSRKREANCPTGSGLIRLLQAFSGGIFYGLPPFLILLCGLATCLNGIFGPLDFDQNLVDTDRATLVRIMQLRDMRHFSQEELRRFIVRVENEFGRQGIKPTFDYGPLEKKIYAHFVKQRSRKNQQNTPQTPATMEQNLMLMIRARYFEAMNDYEGRKFAERMILMRDVVADLKHWEAVYMEFLRAIDVPIPSMMELYRDFEKMIAEFKLGATPEEVARLEMFTRHLSAAMIGSYLAL